MKTLGDLVGKCLYWHFFFFYTDFFQRQIRSHRVVAPSISVINSANLLASWLFFFPLLLWHRYFFLYVRPICLSVLQASIRGLCGTEHPSPSLSSSLSSSFPSGFTYALLSPILKNKTKQATQPSNPWTFTVDTKFLKLSPKGIDHTSHSLTCQPSLLSPHKLLPPLVTKDLHISKVSGCFCPLLCLMASEHLPPLTIIFHNTTFSWFVSLIISTACQILHCLFFFFPSQILIWFRFSTTTTPSFSPSALHPQVMLICFHG